MLIALETHDDNSCDILARQGLFARALDELCLPERGDPDRCEFRSFLPAIGCIARRKFGRSLNCTLRLRSG